LKEERVYLLHKTKDRETNEFNSIHEEWPRTQISGAALSCSKTKMSLFIKTYLHFISMFLFVIPTTQFSVTQDLIFSESNFKTLLSVGLICM
jgi:hypothetical protein